jgi:hypothetical protein
MIRSKAHFRSRRRTAAAAVCARNPGYYVMMDDSGTLIVHRGHGLPPFSREAENLIRRYGK